MTPTTWTRDPTRSIRDNILEHLKARFAEVNPGAPGYDDFAVAWEWVERAPLPEENKLTGPSISILDPRERQTALMNTLQVNALLVAIEFAVVFQLGDDPSRALNDALTEVRRLVMADPQIGGLAINLVEKSSELDIDGLSDKVGHGITLWEVTYRSRIDDPRKP